MKQETTSTIVPVPNSVTWTTIDSLQVPCFSRMERDYIPARLVEERLLNQYPSHMDNVNPLVGYHANQHEVQTLNNILAQNNSSVTVAYAKYTTADVMVSLEDFRSFYEDLKRRFNDAMSTSGGWLQVNNVVVPYVYRGGAKLVPLDIVRYGGHLLTNVNCTEHEVEALTEEVEYLNSRFESGGFSYSLRPSESKLIDMGLVWSLCQKIPRVHELPADDPKDHAIFDETAIIEVQSSASSADSDVEVISVDEVTPILIQPVEDGEVEVCEAQRSVQMENAECEAASTVAVQTPTAISHSQLISTISLQRYVNADNDNVTWSIRKNKRQNTTAQIADSEREAVSTGAVETQTAISHDQYPEAIGNNSEVNFVANWSTESSLLSRDVSEDSAVDVSSPLTNACNGLGDSTSRNSTQGKSDKRGNTANAGKERRKRTKTSMSTGNLKEKCSLAENAELIRRNNSSSATSLSTNTNTESAHSPTIPFMPSSSSAISQFDLRQHEANQFIGYAMYASNRSLHPANAGKERKKRTKTTKSTGNPKEKRSLTENADLIRRNNSSSAPSLSTNTNTASAYSPATRFNHGSNATMNQFNIRPQEANQLMGNAMHSSNRSSFHDASVNWNAQSYGGFPANDFPMYIRRNRFASKGFYPTSGNNYQSFPTTSNTPRYLQHTMVSTSPNSVASRSNEAFSTQRYAMSNTGSSLCYGDTVPKDRNGLASVQHNGALPPHGSETFLSPYKNMSPNGTVRSPYHGNMVLSHGKNVSPDNGNGAVPAYQGNVNLSNLNSMTSGMCNESFHTNLNVRVSIPSEQIMSPQRSDIFSVQQNELLSPMNSRNARNNRPGYLTGEESYSPVQAFQPHAGHLYSGAMGNRPTYPNHNQWNQQPSSMVPPMPPLVSSSPRNLRQSKTNNVLTSLLQTNDDTSLYPSGCFPTGNPHPRSLEAQSGDHPASQDQHPQSLQYQYRNSLMVNKTNAMLAKHCSNLMPPTYESVVQNNGLASTDNGPVSTPSARSSQPSGQKVDYSQTIRTIQDCEPVMTLANSAFIVRRPLYGKRVFHLLKNNTLYVLLESLQRTFFKGCSLESWLYMLDVNCGAKTINLTEEEETAFIECYRLSCVRLHCKRAIAVEEFSKYSSSFRILYSENERNDHLLK